MDLYQQGNSEFVDENYAEACTLYSHALEAEPSNPKILEARANAFLKLESWMEALQDASKALELDPKSTKALLRKGWVKATSCVSNSLHVGQLQQLIAASRRRRVLSFWIPPR